MKSFRIVWIAWLSSAVCLANPVWVFAAESQWVQTGVTGRLVYVPDAEGDRILDFSNVGYRGQGVAAIPNNVANTVTLSPITGDDTASIQAAIDQVASMPLGPNGYRGAVLLQAGEYDIDSQLVIGASGIVLRGVGQGTNDTVLRGRNVGASGSNQRPLIRVLGSGSRTNLGSTRNMIDKVVPAGARSFRVDVPGEFSVGDTVRIERPSTQAWINAVGMDNPPNGDPPWQPGTMNIRYDRTVTRIEGNRLFLDAPLANSFEQQFGGGTIRRYAWNGAINNVGIENLRGDTDFDSPTDEDHAWEFISIGDSQNNNRAEHVWVRDVTSVHFGDSAVLANPGSKWVTVDNATNLDPVSQISGGRRYTFDLSGELGFVTNSSADQGRHDFVNNSTRPPGPNVFHNSTATNANNDSGPHQRWASGTLLDNISVDGDAINVRNRGSLGTTHGWSGANMVIWNSSADSFRVQNPPTAQNWLIGSSGTIVEDTTFGPQPSGNYDQSGPAAVPVTAGGKTSLYDAQQDDARNISEFRLTATGGNWNDAAAWDQRLAPTDVFSVSLRDYLQGDIDDYTSDGPGSLDDAFVDPAWEAFILGSSSHPITGFDDVATNQNVAFTIQHVLDTGEQVVHATLALALRQGGGMLDTDFVRVATSSNKFDFNQLGWDTQINTVDSFVGVLDLGQILADLQSGAVNVQVNDDSGVDWALYTATIATPTSNPAGTVVLIENGGTVMVDSPVGPIGQLNLGGPSSGKLEIDSTGQLSVVGDFAQSANGTLAITLAGELGGEFGALDILGDASLSGILEATLAGGFDPGAGTTLDIITATNVTGSFDSMILPTLGEGLVWGVAYEPSKVSLQVLFAADFSADGLVDGQDFTDWQLGFGSLGAAHGDGDADVDGDVDGGDFLFWQRQFGNTTALASSVQIPEPTAGFLALLAAAALLSCRGVLRA